jgi:hypothetical protein
MQECNPDHGTGS